MSWGDGAGVPTSGDKLVIIGTDNDNLMHIRVFDRSGHRVTDTDETMLPPAQAQAILTLKQRLPGLLPPHVMTEAEKAQVLSEVTSIVGQTYSHEQPLKGLRSWTTVGTPFLHSVPSSAGLWRLVPLIMILWVLGRQWGWFLDYWGSALELIDIGPVRSLVAFSLTYALWMLAPPLLLLVAYRLFKVAATQRSETRYSDARVLEFSRLVQSSATALLVIPALILPWSWSGLRSIAPTVWYLALMKPVFLLPVLYGLVAAALVIGCLLSFFLMLIRSVQCGHRVKRSRRAWELFHDRFRYMACLARDEAINGLRKSQYGIAGPLLPRIRRPGARDYGLAGRTLTPEALTSETRFTVGTFTTLILLPIQQVYDWVLRPLYNEVLAVLVDEFVLGRFTAQAHGADLPGLRLGFVSSTPFPLEGECPRGFRRSGYLRDWLLRRYTLAALLPDETIQAQIHGRFAGPSLDECEELLEATHGRAGQMIEALRSLLGVPSMAAVSLMTYLSQALREGGEWTDLLIHTTYFKNERVLRRIAGAIDPGYTVPPLTPCAVSEPGPGPGAAEFAWPPSGFGWWLIRGMVRGMILASPALAPYLAGLLILYPESREAQLRWASEPGLGLASIIRDAENGYQPGFSCGWGYRRTPPSVRWYATVYAADLDRSSAIMLSADEIAGWYAFRNADIEARAAVRLIAIGKSAAAAPLAREGLRSREAGATQSGDRLGSGVAMDRRRYQPRQGGRGRRTHASTSPRALRTLGAATSRARGHSALRGPLFTARVAERWWARGFRERPRSRR